MLLRAFTVNRVVVTAMSGAVVAGTKRNTSSAFATCQPSGPYTNWVAVKELKLSYYNALYPHYSNLH